MNYLKITTLAELKNVKDKYILCKYVYVEETNRTYYLTSNGWQEVMPA